MQAGGAIWAADGQKGLLSNVAGSFAAYNPPQQDTTIFPRPDSIVTDLAGNTWARNGVSGGIAVRENANGRQRNLSTSTGNGSLPSMVINSLAVDRDGYIWFASDRGVGYIVPFDIFDAGRVDAILPVYGQQKLFSTEKSTALAVEAGNRKWIGTTTGLYLFNADGTELVSHFDAENSPLPSSEIRALRYDAGGGLLYADTPNGLVALRTGSSEAAENLTTVTFFPNPVRPNYDGAIGFKGLMENSTVKVTSLSGRLVFETRSQGGTASWNLRDYTGNRAKGGIYMVFIVSGNGSETLAGKLAVID